MAVLQTNEIFKTELAEGQHRLSDEEIHQVQRVVYEITIDITNLCDKYPIYAYGRDRTWRRKTWWFYTMG